MSEERKFGYPGLSDSMRAEAITFGPTGHAGGGKGGKLFAHSCRILEVAAVIITCIYLAIQTRAMTEQTTAMSQQAKISAAEAETMAEQSKIMAEQSMIMAEQSKLMNEQAKENRLSNKLQVALFLRDHYQTVNKVLAEQQQARDALKLNMAQVLAYMLISDYDAIYQMRKGEVIDDYKWAILDPFIRQQMKTNRWIKNLWRKAGNQGRSPDFKSYVEACVYSDNFDPRIRSANAGTNGITQINKITMDWRDIQLKQCPEMVHY